MPRPSAVVVAGLASGTGLLAAHTFVTPLQPLVSSDPGTAPVAGVVYSQRADSSTMAALGVAGTLAVAAATNRRIIGSRTIRRAKLGDKSKIDVEAQTLMEWTEAGGVGFDVRDFNPAVQVGVTAPFGYFDPLGFCAKADGETFRKLRTAEIKHGRVAMMASVGACVQHYVKFPGFEKVPAGISAVTDGLGGAGTIALLVAAGALEMGIWTEKPDKEPGNFGDPIGMARIGNNYCNNAEDMRNRELNNGRFCMFAAVGIIAAELATGKDAIQQFF